MAFLTIVGLIILFSVIASLVIAYQISIPLLKLKNISKKIAEGDLGEKVKVKSEDEIGQLGKNFNRMVDSLKEVSDALTSISNGNLDVRVTAQSDKDLLGLALVHMVENLRSITSNIQKEATNLTNFSKEMVDSVSQIASSSAETAAAIAETTTSTEELKQTAQVNEEKAIEVAKSSETTLKIVNESEKSLQTTISDMIQIGEK
ncbi:MAG: HAMP domain-containing protein [Parachlamydiaceae bacterium]|nr:MAG: HAMP domain-containing protein [Parachlamydiaceae bacterium]